MKIRYLVRHARRNLLHAKSRTLLTSFAIAIGAFTLTLSLAAGEGLRQFAQVFLEKNVDPTGLTIVEDKRTIEAAGGRNSIPVEYTDNDFTTSNGLTVGQLTEEDVNVLERMPEIKKVTPMYDLQPQYISGPNGKHYSGLTTAYSPPNVRRVLVAGEVPPMGQDIKANEIVMPERFVSVLGLTSPDQAIGKNITIRYVNKINVGKDYSFKVRAVTKKSNNGFEIDTAFMMRSQTARQIAEFQKIPGKELAFIFSLATIESGVSMEEARDAVMAKGYGAATPKDQGGAIYSIVDTLNLATIGFGIITIIASVFGVINTQYISVLERTRYIGLMKALGLRRPQLLWLFMFEAAFIGLVGGVIGISIGLLVGVVSNAPLTAMLGLDHGQLLFIFQPIPLIVLLLFLTVTAMIAGLLPARKASRLDPIDALYTE